MNAAQSAREEKDAHPERFCGRGTCLWRVQHANRPDTPCAKHGPRQSEAVRLANAESLARHNALIRARWEATSRPMTSAEAGAAFGPERGR